LVPIVDPVAAAQLMDHRVGDLVSVPVGGRVARFHEAIILTGRIRRCGVETVGIGGGYASPVVELGPTAVVETGIGTVVITSLPGVGGVHPDMYRALEIQPEIYSMAVVKTASIFQYFTPFSTTVIRADTPGPTQSDIGGLPWERIPRPVYPLDPIDDWRSANGEKGVT
jgi:microcystin degradation protein MlrC